MVTIAISPKDQRSKGLMDTIAIEAPIKSIARKLISSNGT